MYMVKGNMEKIKWIFLCMFMVGALMVVGTVPAGCGQEATSSPGSDTASETSREGDETGAAMPAGSFSAQGSDTMVNMGQNLAEVYMDNVNPDAAMAVTGGGSGTGIAALINDNVDIAQSSRTMKEDEIAEAEANDVEVYEFIVAQDGLAIYVNEENPLTELDVVQLKDILTGAVTDWREVGWDDGGGIDVFSRQSNSGTYVYINENIMHEEDWAPGTRFQPGSSQVVEGVKADRGGIGYSGIGYLTAGVKALHIARVGEEAVSPREAAHISDGSYPIARPLFFYTNGFPEGVIRHYLEWVLSEEGQEAVIDSGFYGIHDEYREKNEATFGK